jgi:hypothetical protein
MSWPADTPPQTSPVFVFGADHSGTTILYRMLAYHPGLTWLSQFSMSRGEIPGRRRRPMADLRDRALRRLPHGWRKESTRLKYLLVPQPGEEATIWSYLLGDEETDSERLRSHLVGFSEANGGKRLIAKRPDFYRHLDFLKRTFPNARFVHIVRDGRPVALSMRAKEVEVRAKRGGERLEPEEALRAAAGFWVDVLARADELSAEERIDVRYEDLCEDVHGTLEAILRHVGVEVDRFPFGRCPSRLSSRNAFWLEQASERELQQISQIELDSLRRHGYRMDVARSEWAHRER